MSTPARGWVLALCMLAPATGGVGCGGQERQVPDPFAVASTCTSGTLLDPNYQPSPEMSPGRACIACHLAENTASGEEGDAPVFTFAGTVFSTGHEPDDCSASPAEGALLQLTDARGMTFSSVVNAGGNFYDEVPGFTFPYTVTLTHHGKTRPMLESQNNGDCNACHTQRGTNTDDPSHPAPGRIVLP